MIPKYFCEKCGWKGNDPIIYDIYEDGGYPICPNSSSGECMTERMEYQGGSGTFMPVLEPTPVLLNPHNTENALMYLRAISA